MKKKVVSFYQIPELEKLNERKQLLRIILEDPRMVHRYSQYLDPLLALFGQVDCCLIKTILWLTGGDAAISSTSLREVIFNSSYLLVYFSQINLHIADAELGKGVPYSYASCERVSTALSDFLSKHQYRLPFGLNVRTDATAEEISDLFYHNRPTVQYSFLGRISERLKLLEYQYDQKFLIENQFGLPAFEEMIRFVVQEQYNDFYFKACDGTNDHVIGLKLDQSDPNRIELQIFDPSIGIFRIFCDHNGNLDPEDRSYVKKWLEFCSKHKVLKFKKFTVCRLVDSGMASI